MPFLTIVDREDNRMANRISSLQCRRKSGSERPSLSSMVKPIAPELVLDFLVIGLGMLFICAFAAGLKKV